MRKAFAFLFFFCLFGCPAISSSVPVRQLGMPIEKKHINEGQPKNISSLKVRDLEKLVGRKLTLKEKIAFVLLKKKLRNEEDKGSKEGKTAFSFGIAAVAFLILGLFVPYVILGSLIAGIVAVVMGSSALKKNPNDRKAHSAKLLGWITLGLIALLLILIAIALSAWSW
jgi:hypothetical protein